MGSSNEDRESNPLENTRGIQSIDADTDDIDVYSQIESIKMSYEMWGNESVVKTQKLTLFFVAQSVLITGYTFAPATGQIVISFLGMLFSLLMVLSIGRTDAYQNHWRDRINKVLNEEETKRPVEKHFETIPRTIDDPDMDWYQKTSQSYIHYPPKLGIIIWAALLAFVLYMM